ncbi:glycosyltransferase family 2 protein [Desulfonatronovibrio hydrogenovorans]|uniref:glycosyltransferase family 2 protein n=1 Tax=Desulfonatronovibrio hydrogenovorans TaxID=53245 RepID=UPI00048DE4F9|nr:glycosyltransferase family 2 protein [Desulfonatronovibrio hydrogenovorans]
MAHVPISVVIPCFNEEDNIGACLESVAWADEILVVDSFSTDRTLEIAGRYTNRVFQREYQSHADQLNWTIPQASHEWVLVVDSDERVPDTLAKEIRDLDLANNKIDGYWIRRSNHLFGKKIRFSGWGRDRVLRLFRRDLGRKENKRVHAEFKVPKAGRLKEAILHYPIPSMEAWVVKINRYTTWKAMDKVEKGNPAALIHFFLRPPIRFFKDSVLRLGLLDGWRGILIAAMSAFAEMIMSAKMMQLKRQDNRGGRSVADL